MNTHHCLLRRVLGLEAARPAPLEAKEKKPRRQQTMCTSLENKYAAHNCDYDMVSYSVNEQSLKNGD